MRKILYYLYTYSRLRPGTRSISLISLLDFYSTLQKKVFVIQVGANDGKTNDPIYRFLQKKHWSGVLLEPQKRVFEKELMHNYQNVPSVFLENAAIAPESGVRKLYKIAFSSARWASGLSSFDEKSIKNLIKNGYVEKRAREEGVLLPTQVADYITTEDVTCVSFDDLTKKYRINHVDLLAIDTEGFDFEVIKMVDFSRMQPAVVLFEHIHLTPADYQACIRYLAKHQYEVVKKGANSIAILRNPKNSLLRLVK